MLIGQPAIATSWALELVPDRSLASVLGTRCVSLLERWNLKNVFSACSGGATSPDATFNMIRGDEQGGEARVSGCPPQPLLSDTDNDEGGNCTL